MDTVHMIKNYLDHNWWTNIEIRNVENWLKNFGDNADIGKFILDQIVFYNKDQLDSYTKSIVEQIKADVYTKAIQDYTDNIDDVQLEQNWKRYLDRAKVMPADIKSTAGGSPHLVIRNYRDIFKNQRTSKIEKIGQNFKEGIREFILVDDFSGTGEQMMELLSERVRVADREIEIGRIPEIFEDVNMMIAVYVIHQKALNRLSKNFPKVNIKYIDLIDEQWDLLNANGLAYRNMTKSETEKIIAYLSALCNELREQRPEYHGLEKYQLNIPIVFEHGCPNNTFLPIFAETESWKQLFKRGDE